MAFDLTADKLAIKAELTNNPLALTGYLAPTAPNDEANANALNLVRTETPIDRESIPVSEISKAIDRDEYNAASAADRDYIKMVTAGGDVNPQSTSEVREGLLQIFAVGSETRTKLTALLTAPASRIDMLFKAGTLSQGGQVTPSDVSNARAAV